MKLQKNASTPNVFLLFVKIFIILFIFMLLLPQIIDGILSIYYNHGHPGGNTVLVNKTFSESDEIFTQMLCNLKKMLYNFKKILLIM